MPSKGAPAVFFDRDGTLNVDIHYLHRPEDFIWTPDAPAAIRHLNERGILTTQYHQALLDYATGKANASPCGRGLNLWKQEKPGIRKRLADIVQKIQPDMFITAR